MKTDTLVKAKENRLEDYMPPDFSVESVEFTFRIFEEYCEVVCISCWNKLKPEAVFKLDGSEFFDLKYLGLNGKKLQKAEYLIEGERLLIESVPTSFQLEVHTRLYPKDNTRLEGLYYSGGMFCTQCEAEGFRHITYFMDRPDVLSVYNVRIEAEKEVYPVLLSNGNPGKTGDLDTDRHFACWHDPFPKPSYLFALVAGDLSCRTDSYQTSEGKNVELNIFVRAADHNKTEYALEALKRSMKWEEERFGLCYDLDVYNIVAVSDFNMGAMENKGLNIFNTKYVLASPETATDDDYEGIEGVIGHEYFHNWTGNRITCRDWFQLSLKEGLTVFRDQEFSSDVGNRAIKRIDDVKVLRSYQFNEDSGPLAHPVRPEKYIEINNFYTVTVYNKGAEVIRMMHLLLGEPTFQKGMNLYVERFDGMAVTCEDFVCCMEDASGRDLSQFRLWYSQAGTPKVEITRRRRGNDELVTFEQSCPSTPGQQGKKPMLIPLCFSWLSDTGSELRLQTDSDIVTELEQGSVACLEKNLETICFRDVPKGAVPSFLQGFSAPIMLVDNASASEYSHIAKHDKDAFARWEAAQKLMSSYLLGAATGSEDLLLKESVSDIVETVLHTCDRDQAFAAELLKLPSENDLGQKMVPLDALAIHSAREELGQYLATKYAHKLETVYKGLNNNSAYSLKEDEKARRRLRNTLLGYLVKTPVGVSVLEQHYNDANNMTDKLAALSLVCESDFGYRQQYLDSFYNDWKKEELVIDKWFAAQAKANRLSTLGSVKALTQHQAFSFKNPNRLRSLISSFSVLNQLAFHGNGEASYRFLADTIITVDSLNPQLAARLVSPLGRWHAMQERNATAMKGALENIVQIKKISRDVKELAQKSLQG